ncbi:MAG: hypothetical protein RL653_1372 [Pseudomonadota bacterium]|jgi:hypothetical protein
MPTPENRDPAPRPSNAGPTREEIALRAFQLSQQRGDGPGSPEEDWLQAERELRLRDALRRR